VSSLRRSWLNTETLVAFAPGANLRRDFLLPQPTCAAQQSGTVYHWTASGPLALMVLMLGSASGIRDIDISSRYMFPKK